MLVDIHDRAHHLTDLRTRSRCSMLSLNLGKFRIYTLQKNIIPLYELSKHSPIWLEWAGSGIQPSSMTGGGAVVTTIGGMAESGVMGKANADNNKLAACKGGSWARLRASSGFLGAVSPELEYAGVAVGGTSGSVKGRGEGATYTAPRSAKLSATLFQNVSASVSWEWALVQSM